MRYTVVWHRMLERQALRVWLYGTDDGRERLNAISTVLNFALANDPDRVGEAIPDEPGVRGWSTTVGALPVYTEFLVKPPDRIVEVRRFSFPPKP